MQREKRYVLCRYGVPTGEIYRNQSTDEKYRYDIIVQGRNIGLIGHKR